MFQLEFLSSFLFFSFSFFVVLIGSFNYVNTKFFYKSNLPKSYPLVGSYFAIAANRDRSNQWIYEILRETPSLTFALERPLGAFRQVITANPANVQHILKTQFSNYPKGEFSNSTIHDFLGSGIFSTDGSGWKLQRKIASHEFNTKSLRKFVETVVDTELNGRLVPILSDAAAKNTVMDFQDVLQCFAFDNICKISFDFDPEYLSPSLHPTEFVVAFEDAALLSTKRFNSMISGFWKIKKFLGIGSERRLMQATTQVRQYAKSIVLKKKQELQDKSSLETSDLLSRILTSGHSDDDFVIDMVISFILAGRDTTSAALTWFFWLVSTNCQVESEILKEANKKVDDSVYNEVKDMVYTHAALSESMRLYPPVPTDTKEALCDDVLPDGTFVKKGTRVTYHPYAMGRMEKLWGKDWAEFRPERWLERDAVTSNWIFIPKDSYSYPVFQAGPRICLGKEMAFLQMKRVVAGVLPKFRVVPMIEKGTEPVYISYLTSKMEGGFPVKFEKRESKLLKLVDTVLSD